MNPESFRLGAWLANSGQDADIAICTRVRIARNVHGYRFSTMMDEGESAELTERVGRVLTAPDTALELQLVELTDMPRLDRNLLVERHLISRELAHAERPRGAAVDPAESISVMINEEDHIRAQVFASGLEVHNAWDDASRLDRAMQQQLPFAFSEAFGYLTACPTNVGTGLRVSVMVHLPGMVWSEDIETFTRNAQKIHLAVRGLYGEGSRASGDFYQLSNQVTLGRTEDQILDDVGVAVGRMIEAERQMRASLLSGARKVRTLDRIHRAQGTLASARILSTEEALDCLSAVRFGAQQGVLEGPAVEDLNRAMLQAQPAHLQQTHGGELEAEARDELRARMMRQLIAGG